MSEIRVDTISEKTSANGVAVDGVTLKDGGIAATTASTITTDGNTAQLTLKSTDADANVGPDFVLQRDSGSPADDDSLGRIRFVADNDAGEALDHISINASIRDASDGTEDAQLTFNMLTAGAVVDAFHISPTETVFNDASVDRNLRIESNDNATMLVVDGENNRVGIGSNPDLGAGLHIKTADTGASVDGNADELVIEGTRSGLSILSANNDFGYILFGDDGSNNIGSIRYGHSANDLRIIVGGNEAMVIDATGAVTKPDQPCVLAYSSSAQNDIATGVVTIQLDAEVYDVGADFNTSNYTFTAPVTGKYMCSGNITMNDVDTAFQWIYGRFNSSNRIYYMANMDPRIEMTADGLHTWTFSALVDMDANDTLKLDTRSSAHGAAQNNITFGTATAPETFMTVYLAV